MALQAGLDAGPQGMGLVTQFVKFVMLANTRRLLVLEHVKNVQHVRPVVWVATQPRDVKLV